MPKLAKVPVAPPKTLKPPKPAAGEPVSGEPDLKDPSLYLNRELSLLAFQRRVLEEAEDKRNPLLERVKFLAILGSNLDEFFMVRVAGLAAQMEAGAMEAGPRRHEPARATGGHPARSEEAAERGAPLPGGAHRGLNEQGIFIHDYAELSDHQRKRAAQYFDETIFPVLTPLAFDPGRPFPHISNLSLNLAVLIRDHSRPRALRPRQGAGFAAATGAGEPPDARREPSGRACKRVDLVWLEEVIAANLSELFPGMEMLESHPFHVTRDAEMAIKELEAEDLLETIEEGVRQRRFRQRRAADGDSGHARSHPRTS